jgi:uncharacterized protein involved in exopolysaccharide biosynthesis
MSASYDVIELLGFLRRRWRIMVYAPALAAVLALGISSLLPKSYTATAVVVIEPPGGSDTRVSTAVSPIYLESLKTYERYADSDTLFARAAGKFGLIQRTGATSIEALKQKVLRVSKLRDTKILELKTTLPDPELAQHVVQYLAEETVRLSREENLSSDLDVITDAESQLAAASQELKRAQAEWITFLTKGSAAALEAEEAALTETAGKLDQALVETQGDFAEMDARAKAGDDPFALRQGQALQARLKAMEKRSIEQKNLLAQQRTAIALRVAEKQARETQLNAAQVAERAARDRVRDLKAGVGMRGERLRVIDPGIVPQRPSSPNLLLNAMIAGLLAFVAAIAYLSLSFGYRSEAPVRNSADWERVRL